MSYDYFDEVKEQLLDKVSLNNITENSYFLFDSQKEKNTENIVYQCYGYAKKLKMATNIRYSMLSSYNWNFVLVVVGDLFYSSPAVGHGNLLWATYFVLLMRNPALCPTKEIRTFIDDILNDFNILEDAWNNENDVGLSIFYLLHLLDKLNYNE